jgi:hypothetical protein
MAVFSASDDGTPKYVQVYWDGIGKNVNLRRGCFYSEPRTPTFVTKDGVQTVKIGGGGSRFNLIDINDDLFPNDKAVPSAVTVRYYDEGTGYVTLRYESSLGTFTEPEKLVMEDTKTWKEYTFHLDDIFYRNANDSADIILAGWSMKYGGTPAPVYVQWLKIEKCLPNNSVITKVTSEHKGNVFDAGDEKKLDIQMRNISELPIIVGAKYQVLKYDKTPIEEGELTDIHIGGEESTTIPVNVNVSEYGCYWLRLNTYYEYENANEPKKENDYADYDFSVVRKLGIDEKPSSLMKVCTHYLFNRGVFEDNTELMRQIGITGMRDEVKWQDVEYESGKYRTPTTKAAKFIEGAAEGLTENMFLLSGGHTLYNGGDWRMPVTDAQIEAWKGYVEYVTTAYKGSVKYYELWNEPNLTNFNIDMASATQYAELAKVTYPIVKKNDPDAIFCVFSTAQIPVDWIKEACDAGILNYADAVTVHPYDWSGEGSGVDKNFRNSFYIQRMKEFRNLMAEYGHSDIPIISTELGITTITSQQSPIGQAALVTQIFAMTQGENLSESIFYYDFQNDQMTAELYENNGEANWGFIKHQKDTVAAAAKPLYVAMANYNKLLSDAENIDGIVEGRTSAYRFRRNADGEQVIVLWNDNQSESVGLDLGIKQIEVLDMYGNSRGRLESEYGRYSFEVTFEPIYIIGEFAHLKICEPEIKIDNGRVYAANSDFVTFNLTSEPQKNLTVKTQAGYELEVTECQDISDGIGKIQVATSKDAQKDNELLIYLYDGDKQVYYSKVHIMIVEPFEVTVDVEPYSKNSHVSNVAVVTVKNTSNSTNISGTVKADFSEYGEEIETRRFYDVKPGNSVSVRLNMPKSIIGRTVSAEGSITLENGYTKDTVFRLSKSDVSYCNTPPKITGDVDYSEWNGSSWFAADDEYAARTYPSWKGKQDCAALCTMKWDYDNLYLLAEVSDDRLFNDYEPFYMWSGDGLQVAFTQISSLGIASNEFTELGLGPSKNGIVCWRYSSQTMYNEGATGLGVGVVDNVKVTLEKQNGKWIYRAKMPWSEIFGENAKINGGEYLGFSLIVNDNDGNGREGYLEYTSGIGNGKNTSLFGRIYLKK